MDQYKEKIEATLRAIESDGAIIFIRFKHDIGFSGIERASKALREINKRMPQHTFLVLPYDCDVLVAQAKVGELQDIMIQERTDAD